MHNGGVSSQIGGYANNGGPDEDRPRGRSGQSHGQSQSRAKSQAWATQGTIRSFEVGDEVVLLTCNISIN